eukprot:CAMPEP_0113944922 /NCGR_PEP_ID=MMETSP1339-20121228/37853_1 /TAXON_ID=94617 /ORGANISM="Fibrocapsa japonica" /LENGTH=370 /DNA_ID=CAMNT_0000950287 /DNA_START=72 /DNA_END=1184 /DNA_ORIENTATION=+ /assembly_acc=CAM_ASM_000762
MISASAGVILASLVVNPIDVVKTRQQAHVAGNFFACHGHTGSGFFKVLGRVWLKEGIRGLYGGLVPTLIGLTPATVAYMVLYDTLRPALIRLTEQSENNPRRSRKRPWEVHRGEGPKSSPSEEAGATARVVATLTAGGASRTIVTFILGPLELLRTQRMAGIGRGSKTPQSLWEMAKCAASGKSGWRGLWTGTSAMLWRDVPFSMMYWSLYEEFKRVVPATPPSFTVLCAPSQGWARCSKEGGESANDLHHQERWSSIQRGEQSLAPGGPPAWWSSVGRPFLASTAAATLATCATTPFDVIKTRQQVHLSPGSPSLSVFSTAEGIFKEGGLPAFYKGNLSRIARIGPASAVMISSYEIGKTFFSQLNRKL